METPLASLMNIPSCRLQPRFSLQRDIWSHSKPTTRPNSWKWAYRNAFFSFYFEVWKENNNTTGGFENSASITLKCIKRPKLWLQLGQRLIFLFCLTQSSQTVVGSYKGHAWPALGEPQGARPCPGYFQMPSHLITRTYVILKKSEKSSG